MSRPNPKGLRWILSISLLVIAASIPINYYWSEGAAQGIETADFIVTAFAVLYWAGRRTDERS